MRLVTHIKSLVVWTTPFLNVNTMWWCEPNLDGVNQNFDGVIEMKWTKFWRCDQILVVWSKKFSVWTNVHFLEIVWSHRCDRYSCFFLMHNLWALPAAGVWEAVAAASGIGCLSTWHPDAAPVAVEQDADAMAKLLLCLVTKSRKGNSPWIRPDVDMHAGKKATWRLRCLR